jgi:serine/threonine-protein kinase RsbW
MLMEANGASSETWSRQRLDLHVRASSKSLHEVRGSLASLTIPPELLDDARVLLSELVGNSIRHSGLQADEYVHITAEWSGARLRIAVHDRPRSAAPPPVAGSIRPRPGAESGWGLFIVDRLASRWGTDGTGYWFELDGDRTIGP